MNKAKLFLGISFFMCFGFGCVPVVGGLVGGAIVAEEVKKDLEDKKAQGAIIGEVDPNATVTKLWLCDTGNYIYGNEYCNTPLDKTRVDISAVIKTRFPNYQIVKIERARENVYDVFYVQLKK